VQQILLIEDKALRQAIKNSLEAMQPSEVRNEQYCEYSFKYKEGKENVVVKQYNKGKLQVQGQAGGLYERVMETILVHYNRRYPDTLPEMTDGVTSSGVSISPDAEDITYPYIGTDESGKGDYFGPLVIAGVCLDENAGLQLEALGVKDSKALADKKCMELAEKIRELCPGKYAEVEILPERYNSFYDQLKQEGKNLNHLLAWGHARVIENLLADNDCPLAIADKFGDEKYIQSKLMHRGRSLQLYQTPKAERYTAVAAASILARDRFLLRMGQLSRQLGVELPKGASAKVVEAAQSIVRANGRQALGKAAKLHFKTTAAVDHIEHI
jgi:ribonuclease HIII